MVTLLTLESVTFEKDTASILKQLERLTKLCQDGEQRVSLDGENFTAVSTLLKQCLAEGDPNLKRDDNVESIFVEAYRFLRNAVVACPKNQDFIRRETDLLKVTNSFLDCNCTCETGSVNIVAIRCALQFLANMMVDNVENCRIVSSLILKTLGNLMITFPEDEKVIQYSAMVVHLGLKQAPEGFLQPEVFKALLNNLQLEFVIYSMESLVKLAEFPEFFESLDGEVRIKIMSFLKTRSDLLQSVDEKVIILLSTSFIERSDFILKSKVGDRDDTFCWEIAVLLEVLCSLSAESDILQHKSNLLTSVLYLLRGVHEAGKSNADNVFAPVEDLAKLTSTSKDSEVDDIRAHPTFQFKAHLIRLVANLSYRNRANQDKVRELDCLPIILDNCKLDARNPFIGQWSVLAVRNLCEGNKENQAYIREVQRVDTEKLLPKLDLIDIG